MKSTVCAAEKLRRRLCSRNGEYHFRYMHDTAVPRPDAIERSSTALGTVKFSDDVFVEQHSSLKYDGTKGRLLN